MSEHIGTLFPKPFGYRTECAVGQCGWYQDVSGDRAEAEKRLRSHAAAAHPQPIRVHREEPRPLPPPPPPLPWKTRP